MPCPHNEITIVQRSQRQSAVAAAAYQSGEKLFCEYDQQVKHYPEKRGIVHNEILLPANAPPEYADRNTLVVNEQLGIQEIEIIINCSSKDETVQKIVSSLSVIDMKLTCRKDDEIFQLDPANILYIESVDRKTFLYTEQQIFETERRLYELEAYLENCSFFRASKAIIINLQRVQSLRPELGARLLLTMDNKEKIVVSRKYAKTIKNALGVI